MIGDFDMRLSIVTITFNAEKSIEKTILSVINQTVPVYEYLFIDGGSTDRTNEIIDSYKEAVEEKGISFFHLSEKDRGISDAFNKGILRAKGDFIGIINADDELLANTNEILQEYVSEHECDIVYGNSLWIDEANGLEYIKKPKGSLDRLYYDLVLIHPSTFVSKASYERQGIFNIEYKLCMDKELLLRMYIGGERFGYVDKELTIMRAGGASDQDVVKTVREGIKLSNAYHKPKIYTYTNAARKIVKHKLSVFLKKSGLYSYIKK